MRLTVRHRFDFGDDSALVGDDLVRPEAWDALRTQTHGPFEMAATREQLEAQLAGRPEILERASEIDGWTRERGVTTLASYGVGGAVLELALLQMNPGRQIVATDYGEATLERLRAVLPELEVVHHDLRRDGPLPADLHLFHRIDTEFSNRELRDVLGRFAGVPLIVVATEVHDVRSLALELRKGLSGATRAGWARNRAAFEALWSGTHDAHARRFNDLDGWTLEPRAVSGPSA